MTHILTWENDEVQVECREFRESILGVMPHRWVFQYPIFSFPYLLPTCYVLMLITSVHCFLNQQERREDTKFELAHFRKHKRKAHKQIPGRKTTLGIHKPDDALKPGKDPGNRIANVISKTANLASSTKTPKVIMTISSL